MYSNRKDSDQNLISCADSDFEICTAVENIFSCFCSDNPEIGFKYKICQNQPNPYRKFKITYISKILLNNMFSLTNFFFEKDNILFQQVSIIVDLRVSRSELQHVFLEVRVKMSLQIHRCGDEVDCCGAPLDE